MKPVLETKSTYMVELLIQNHFYTIVTMMIHGGLDLTVLIVSMVMILRQQNSISEKNQTSKKCLK